MRSLKSILTKTQREALKALAKSGGEGAVLKNGTVLSCGEVLGQYYGDELISAYSKYTWSVLRKSGIIESAGAGRIRISEKGRDYL